MKVKEDNKSYEEELIVFYNKYLNLGLGEGYLIGLTKKCAELWQKKGFKKENQNPFVSKYEISYEDYASLTKLDQEFMNFYNFSAITINDDYDSIIDSFGTIIRFDFKKELDKTEEQELSQYVNQNILDFLKLLPEIPTGTLNQVKDMILQNILVSKIYKAIYEEIGKTDLIQASLFALANAKIFSYDDELKGKLNYEKELKLDYPRLRSLR